MPTAFDRPVNLKPEMLPQLDWSEYEYGTNLHHALLLGRQLLARHKTPNKQFLIITDGEPTAHLEQGQSYFNYPPSWRTIQETLRAVERLVRRQLRRHYRINLADRPVGRQRN